MASALKTVTLLCADFLSPLPQVEPDEAREIALIRVDGIGDFILWLPFAHALRQRYRDRPVVLVANASWAALARKFPYWDEVWAVDPGRMERDRPYRRQVLSTMRARNFAAVVQPTFSRNARTGDSLVRASKAAERIGFRSDATNTDAHFQRITNRWYTLLVRSEPGTVPEIERNREFVRGLGISEAPKRPEIVWPAPAAVGAGPYFVIFSGASWDGRRWPSSHFATLADRIAQASGWRCVIAGGEADRALAAPIAKASACPTTDLTGRTSLDELMGVLAGAQLVITNETGAVHMAALVDTPSICILGGGHFGRFAPYPSIEHITTPPMTVHSAMECFGCNWRCPYPRGPGRPIRCVEAVTVDMAWKAVAALVGNSADEQPDRRPDRGTTKTAPLQCQGWRQR